MPQPHSFFRSRPLLTYYGTHHDSARHPLNCGPPMLRPLLAALLGLPSVLFAEDWDGPYVGGGLTYSIGETEVVGNRFAYDVNAAETRVPHDFEGFGLSAFAGWNKRFDERVFGAELRVTNAKLGSTTSVNSGGATDEVSIGWTAEAIGRVGYVLDSTLIYGGGGLAFASISNLGGDLDGGLLDVADAHMLDDVRLGAVLVLGAEVKLGSGWGLRGEFSQTDFRTYLQANQQGSVPGSQFYVVDNGPIQAVTLGVIYEF